MAKASGQAWRQILTLRNRLEHGPYPLDRSGCLDAHVLSRAEGLLSKTFELPDIARQNRAPAGQGAGGSG